MELNIPQKKFGREKSLPIYNCVPISNGLPNELLTTQGALTLKRRFKDFAISLLNYIVCVKFGLTMFYGQLHRVLL